MEGFILVGLVFIGVVMVVVSIATPGDGHVTEEYKHRNFENEVLRHTSASVGAHRISQRTPEDREREYREHCERFPE